jgi:hypothetical protein
MQSLGVAWSSSARASGGAMGVWCRRQSCSALDRGRRIFMTWNCNSAYQTGDETEAISV